MDSACVNVHGRTSERFDEAWNRLPGQHPTRNFSQTSRSCHLGPEVAFSVSVMFRVDPMSASSSAAGSLGSDCFFILLP